MPLDHVKVVFNLNLFLENLLEFVAHQIQIGLRLSLVFQCNLNVRLLLDYVQLELCLSFDQLSNFALLSLQVINALVKFLKLSRLALKSLIFKLESFD